ncbi:unnamed protein product, partial [Prorocentrum cordatum]
APARPRSRNLSAAGVSLLGAAVEKTVAAFQAGVGADADGAADLRRFLQLPKEFKAEVRRMARWRKPGRCSTRRRRGITCDRKQPGRVRGLRGVWAVKVRAHCRRFLKPLRVEGLRARRSAALAIRSAGVPVQSGAVPVEHSWECLKGMLPRGARAVSLRWFNVFSQLAFLRFNSRRCGAGCLPAWAERGSLLAQRLEIVVMLGVELDETE